MFKISFADYSPYSQFCSAIKTAICSEIYWKTFKTIENSETVVQFIYTASNQIGTNSFLVTNTVPFTVSFFSGEVWFMKIYFRTKFLIVMLRTLKWIPWVHQHEG